MDYSGNAITDGATLTTTAYQYRPYGLRSPKQTGTNITFFVPDGVVVVMEQNSLKAKHTPLP